MEDLVAARDEPSPGPDWEPLLEHVVTAGRPARLPSLVALRERHRQEMTALPAPLLQVDGSAVYPVGRSGVLLERQRRAVESVRSREALP